MKIAVLLKQVPDTASKIRIKDDGSGVITDGLKYVINPYDEFAVEEALRLKEKAGAGEVVILTVGPKRGEEALRYALAMGADRAVHFLDPAFDALDGLGVARLIAKATADEKPDLILAGKQAVDDDCAQVPAMVAELLGWPCVNVVDKLERDGDRITAWRRVGGGAREVWKTTLPAVVTAEKGLNTPRYASLPGIMKAKSKPVRVVDLAGCGLAREQLAAALVVRRYLPPPERKAGKKLTGTPADMARELARLLREEAKVI